MKIAHGKLISFEGIDGSGKSSALAQASNFLERQGIKTICIRQPGGTSLGEKLRDILKNHPENISPISEVLMLSASFHEIYHQKISPELSKGTWVLCDRFTDSTIAYQSGGGGLKEQSLQKILEVACPLVPNKTFYYDISAKKALERVSQRGSGVFDNFEKRGYEYQEKIRQKFLKIAKENPRRITVIDTEVFDEVETGELTILELKNVLKKA